MSQRTADIPLTSEEGKEVVQGDDAEYSMTLYKDKANDTRKDITDWELFVTVKYDIDEDDSNADIKVDNSGNGNLTITNATQGEFEFTLPSDQTEDLEGMYEYDIKAKKSDGKIQRLVKSDIEFVQQVTRRTD